MATRGRKNKGNKLLKYHKKEEESMTVGGGALITVPIIPGILYSGEQIQICPLCSDRLMWYCLPEENEILACANPVCAYPFDETGEYEVRPRNHDKVCIEGCPAPKDEEPASSAFTSKRPSSSAESSEVKRPKRCDVSDSDACDFDQNKLVEDCLIKFRQTPRDQWRLKVDPHHPMDMAALEAVMDSMRAIQQEDTVGALD